MKVALWAEIRRLSEIEKLSGRVIARRLHCSRDTVAAALELTQPPTSAATRRASVLDPYLDRIKELLVKYPNLSAVRLSSREVGRWRSDRARWAPGPDSPRSESIHRRGQPGHFA